jgi:hypothetical protein
MPEVKMAVPSAGEDGSQHACWWCILYNSFGKLADMLNFHQHNYRDLSFALCNEYTYIKRYT